MIPGRHIVVAWMRRVIILATLPFVIPVVSSSQALSVLHIKVVLVDAGGKVTPVPGHALLVGDNPPTAVPRRIVTKVDGTVDVSLRPGNYTVESDAPIAFRGKSYEWTQFVDIVAGRDSVLELTAANADVVERAASPTPGGAAPLDADPAFLLPEWQDSVVALWTANTRASGFLVDRNGLVATNQRVIGNATTVEVQLSQTLKVAGRVLAADPVRDVAVIAIAPTVAGTVKAIPLGCGRTPKPSVVEWQKIFTIGSPIREQKALTPGNVDHVEPHFISSDLLLAPGAVGGPVFAADGVVIGITSPIDEQDRHRSGESRVVRADDVCEVVASAEQKMTGAPPDSGHLPVEPQRPFPQDALKEAARQRVGSLTPYQLSASEFDVAFVTPVLIYGGQHQVEQTNGRGRWSGVGAPDSPQTMLRLLTDFGNWSDYMADIPPVLLIRVTPKLVEGFWTTVARGAARTQGIALPPIKHFKSGFARLRAFCGDAEVTPIHPFRIEQRISDTEAIHEGLYVFDPGALGPQCGSAKLVLYSEKEPEKGDTRAVDPKVLEQMWQDFGPYRAVKD